MQDRTLKLLAVGSVVANLFLAGVLAGVLVIGAQALHGDRDRGRDRDGGGRPGGRGDIMEPLSPDQRRAFRSLLRDAGRASEPHMDQSNAVRLEIARIIRTEPFSPQAMAEAQVRARALDDQARQTLDAHVRQRLTEMSPEDRAAFSGLMTRRYSQRPD